MTDIGLPLSELDTPILWVDLDIMEENIAWLIRQFERAGVKWRPHIKSIKIPALALRLIEAGAIGVTCAKLGEAEVMVDGGIQDILIANQIVGSKKISRLVKLCEHVNVKVAVDNAQNVTDLGHEAAANGITIGTIIEMDIGLGRGGVQSPEDAVKLAQLITQTPGLAFLGLMGWEGHATLIQDVAAKEGEIRASIGKLLDATAMCRDAGIAVEIVSAGGSATSEYTPFIPGITEIQAGGAVFSDIEYQRRGVTNKPALFVHAMVSSRPTPERIIFDCGFKSLPAWNSTPKVMGIPGVKSIRMSAEHATVTLEAPDTHICIGDTFEFIVGYGDFTVFLHDTLYGIRKGVVEAVWEVVGRGKLQ